MKYIPFLLCVIFISVLLLSPLALSAQNLSNASEYLNTAGSKAGYAAQQSLPELVGKYIRIFLTLLGIIFMVLMVYGGYLWMTSYGNKDKVEKAKTLITDAIIGLIIVLGAYALSSFIVTQLVKQTTT